MPALAANLPAGSYLQSCTNVTFGGGQLTASCSGPNGQRVRSTTSLNCKGDIGNVNGYLRCNGSAGAAHHGGRHHGGGNYGGNLPAGSYQQGCTNARVAGGTLTAECSAGNGGRVTTSLNVNCAGDIGNVNGRLRCNGGGFPGGGLNGGRAPSGSYQQSCTNIRMQGSTLTASCSAPNGQRITSSVGVRSCPSGSDIGNRNGYLSCRR